MLRKILFALLIASGFVNAAVAANDPMLERGLLDAMRLKPGTTERSTKSGPMIMAYVKDGYLDLKPIQRADYVDYRLFKKPAQLMGHTLMLVEEEYMTKYSGCCVNEGLGVTVKVVGKTTQLEKFAEQNGCAFTPHVDLADELKSVGIKSSIPKAEYATLSCRERDIAADR
jgi:hypothetical protein